MAPSLGIAGWGWVLASPVLFGAAGAIIAGLAGDAALSRRSRALCCVLTALIVLMLLHAPATLAGFGAGAQAVALALGVSLALCSAALVTLGVRLGLPRSAATLAGALMVPLLTTPLFLSNELLDLAPLEHRAELAHLIVAINPYLTLARALGLDPLKLPAMYARFSPIGRSHLFAYSAWTWYVTRALTMASALWGLAWMVGKIRAHTPCRRPPSTGIDVP